jgi:DNA-binding NarL/FixJ family response regulator
MVHSVAPFTDVIFFENFEDHQVVEKLIRAGACDYVAKTSEPETGITQLLKNIRFLTSKKHFQNDLTPRG